VIERRGARPRRRARRRVARRRRRIHRAPPTAGRIPVPPQCAKFSSAHRTPDGRVVRFFSPPRAATYPASAKAYEASPPVPRQLPTPCPSLHRNQPLGLTGPSQAIAHLPRADRPHLRLVSPTSNRFKPSAERQFTARPRATAFAQAKPGRRAACFGASPASKKATTWPGPSARNAPFGAALPADLPRVCPGTILLFKRTYYYRPGPASCASGGGRRPFSRTAA